MRDNFPDSVIMRRKPAQVDSRPKVTIAIGLISKPEKANGRGEIVLACDSQTTYGHTKDLNVEKFTTIRFQNGKALFVHSGYVREGRMALEIIQRKAKTARIEDAAAIIRDGMRECRAELLKGLDLSAEKEEAFLKRMEFEFLIAFYLDGTPHLLHTDIFWGKVVPIENGRFSAIGIPGEDLARYLIKEYHKADAGFIHSDQIAVAVIEKVKEHIDGCGGPTKVGIVFPSNIENFHSQVCIYPEETVNLIVCELEQQEKSISQHRINLMRQMMEDTNKALEEKLTKNPIIIAKFER